MPSRGCPSGGRDASRPDAAPGPSELQIRIDCRGRRAEDVLSDLVRGLAAANAEGRDPLVVLQDLGLLADSVVALIKGISRRLVEYPRTVTFWEASGYTEAFLSAMENPLSRDDGGIADR